MHAELDHQRSGTDLTTDESAIYLPPAGDTLEAWRELPFHRESWFKVLTYWVNELRWRQSYWGSSRRS